MSSDSDSEELGPSELGTKHYWDKAYSEELENYTHHGDVGEMWFGEDSALRMIDWLVSCTTISTTDSIIDLGCGNGMLLIELARRGFSQLMGVDYSERAIELATQVCAKQGLCIIYRVCDLLEAGGSVAGWGRYRVALDKGTYDAVSLHPDHPRTKRTLYIANVWALLQDGGVLVLTTCNWTAPEVVAHFAHKFKLLHIIPTPTFQFGGKMGTLVTSLVLEKVS